MTAPVDVDLGDLEPAAELARFSVARRQGLVEALPVVTASTRVRSSLCALVLASLVACIAGAARAETPPAPLPTPAAAGPEAPSDTGEVAGDAAPPPSTESGTPLPGAAELAPAPAVPPPVGATARQPGTPVRFGEVTVFELHHGRGAKSAEERAREAGQVLVRAAEAEARAIVRVAKQGDVAVVLAGDAPVIELDQLDAELAGASSLEVHAAAVASSVREALKAEQRRAAVARAVFSFSLAVFFGLIAFYLIRRLGELAEKARSWLDRRPDRELVLHLRGIEVMRAAAVRSTGVMGVGFAKWLAQFGVAYAWLVVALSMFDTTRDYTQRLTGFVLGPLSTLMERIASALPLMLVAALAALAVLALVRYVDLFFKSVGRGETPLPWLAADLAAPTSLVLRAGIVVAALVFAAPVVIGEGALSRAGSIILITVALASTPVLASAVVGAAVLFGRRLRVGDHVEVAGRRGRITAVTFLDVRLADEDRVELRVPHLYALLHPMRVSGPRLRATFELRAPPGAAHAELVARLRAVAQRHARDVVVELATMDPSGALYRVSGACDGGEERTALGVALLEAQATPGRPESKSA